tara:strand:+ start:175958 stop:176152 length:195 start_codon:yes stop_codon:yes gene_type:complete
MSKSVAAFFNTDQLLTVTQLTNQNHLNYAEKPLVFRIGGKRSQKEPNHEAFSSPVSFNIVQCAG